jgi:hypothetical protein
MNKRLIPFAALLLAACLSTFFLAGCAARSAPTDVPTEVPGPSESVAEQAALEATAIIEQAQATALVLKAHAQATAILEQSGGIEATPFPVAGEDVGEETAADASRTSTVSPTPVDEGDYWAEVLSVSFGADGTLIMVEFKASRKAADDVWPGRVSVTDEGTGTVYSGVSVMPIIGPLISRPKNTSQTGYVMLNNIAPGLPPGALVTVTLGDFQKEHVQVSKNIQ